MKKTVTDISAAASAWTRAGHVKRVRGTVACRRRQGRARSSCCSCGHPLMVRTLLADIGGEPYALPLASIVRTLKLPKNSIATSKTATLRLRRTADRSREALRYLESTTRADRRRGVVIVLGDHTQHTDLSSTGFSASESGRTAARYTARQDQGHLRGRPHGGWNRRADRDPRLLRSTDRLVSDGR